MGWRRVSGIVIALVFAPALAGADGVEVTPFGAFRVGGELDNRVTGATELEETGAYGLIVDVPIGNGVQIELLWSHQDTDLLAGEGVFGSPRLVDFDVDYYHVGAVWEWGPEYRGRRFGRGRESPAGELGTDPRPRTRPFVALTAGIAEWNPQGLRNDSETLFSIGIGGGAKYIVARHVGFRFEGRAFGSFFNGSRELFCDPDVCLGDVSGSLLWQFEGAVGLVLKF